MSFADSKCTAGVTGSEEVCGSVHAHDQSLAAKWVTIFIYIYILYLYILYYILHILHYIILYYIIVYYIILYYIYMNDKYNINITWSSQILQTVQF